MPVKSALNKTTADGLEEATLASGIETLIQIPRLFIYKEDKLIHDIPLSDKTISIGRSKSCNYILPDIYISRQHIKITKTKSGYMLEDMNTQIGVLQEGKKVKKQIMADGDIFTLSAYKIIYREAKPEASKKSKNIKEWFKLDKTVKKQKKLIVTRDGETIKEIYLNKNDYYIGRTSDREICLDDASVSRLHARIYSIDDQIFIEDQNSNNGPFVNGTREHSAQLEIFDEVGICGFLLYLVNKSATLKDVKKHKNKKKKDSLFSKIRSLTKKT